MVRGVCRGELKALGYRVIVTRATRPRRSRYLRGPEQIHLLFSDVVMPGGMFGAEACDGGCRLRPRLKILLTSSYTEHPAEALDGLGREVRILKQALPPARSGVDAALGAESGLIGAQVFSPRCEAAGSSLRQGPDTSRSGHNKICHEQHRIDGKDPEHRALQHGPICHPDSSPAHQDRKVIGELAEVTRGKEQGTTQKLCVAIHRKEGRPAPARYSDRRPIGRVDRAQKRHAGSTRLQRDRISTLLPGGYQYLQRIGLGDAELDERGAEPECVEEQNEIWKSHGYFP